MAALRCPVCGGALEVVDRTLRCAQGHGFDVAKQGHVDLRGPRGSHGEGDDPAMVVRRLSVLEAGHFDPLLDAIVAAVRTHVEGMRADRQGLIVDVGAGPGVHLARVLDALPDRHGLAVDVSKHAARRAAPSHPRSGAIVADVWHGLPIAGGAAAAVLDVFAPRDADEFHRILAPTGVLVVVTPAPDHLAAVAGAAGIVAVDPGKERRLAATFAARFSLVDRYERRWTLRIDRATAAALVGMGPGGHHLTAEELAARVLELPVSLDVEAAVILSIYRPLGADDRGPDDGEVMA